MKTNEKKLLYFIKTYKLNSIFVKNLAKITAIFLIPVLIIIFLCYSYFQSALEKNLNSESIKNTSTMSAIIDNVIYESKQLSGLFVLKNSVIQFTRNLNLSPEYTNEITNEILNDMSTVTSIYRYIDSIYVYSEERDTVIAGTTSYIMSNFSDSQWLEYYNELSSSGIYIFSRNKNNIYPYFITVINPVFSGTEKKGAVVVNINIENLCDIIKRNNPSSENFTILLYDKIAFSDDYSLIGQSFSDICGDINRLKAGNSGSTRITLNDTNMHVVYQNSASYDITYFSFIPQSEYKHRLSYEFISLKLILVIIVILCIAVALFMSTLSFDAVKKIIMLIDYPESSDNSRNMPSELKYIMSNIIQSSNSNKELEFRLAEQLKKLKNATTIAMQSQINSHFLCNTLDMINWHCYAIFNSKNDISKMLGMLGKMIGSGIDIYNYTTTIYDEVEYTKNYIALSKIRYKNKFNIFWNIDDETLECDTVRITLQPIIENSIAHGIRNLEREGNIWVDIHSSEKNINITIADDGIGMSEDDIEKLNMSLSVSNSKKQKHIGLSNINSRIKMIYGDNYGLNVFSNDKGGITVKVTIPKSEVINDDSHKTE